MVGTKAVGVLEFFADEPFQADPDLLELLLSVGTQLGRVVERQRSEEGASGRSSTTCLQRLPARPRRALHPREPAVRGVLGLRDDEIRGKTPFEVAALSDVLDGARGSMRRSTARCWRRSS